MERWLSYKGTCHVIFIAKLHDMYLYKTAPFYINLHRFKVCLRGGSLTQISLYRLTWTFAVHKSQRVHSSRLRCVFFFQQKGIDIFLTFSQKYVLLLMITRNIFFLDKTYNQTCATSEDSDQPEHPKSDQNLR